MGLGDNGPMWWTMVDGYPLPNPIAGHRALELCNTRAAWEREPRREDEWLRDYDRFAVWARFHGIVDDETGARLREAAAADPKAAGRVLAEVRRLRDAVYPVLTEPGDPEPFARLAGFAERASRHRRLEFGGDGSAQWTIDAEAGLRMPLHVVALEAADLAASAERSQVRACPGSDCGWLFLDSRGRRRWCDMATCGNRAKARSFAERQR